MNITKRPEAHVIERDSEPVISYEPRRIQWDYRSSVMSVKADISQYGSEGWELVTVVVLHNNPENAIYHFKRRRA